MLEAECEPDQIVAVFMGYPIGEKAWGKDDPEEWIYDDIDRIKKKMEGYEQVAVEPVELPKRTMVIPSIDSLDVEYRTLINHAHRDLIKVIRGYGNITSESQEEALYTLLHSYAALANGKITGRIAVPLPTGLGKTTSISSFLGRAYQMGILGKQKGNFTVAVAASKVDQLCDLHEALIKAGIPENYISLVHSYSYNPEVQRDADGQLPKGYAALPASDDKQRPIMLLSHNKVKNGPAHAFDDSLQKRTFTIWDESLISTDSKVLDVRRLAHGLNGYEFGVMDLKDMYDAGRSSVESVKLEVAINTLEYIKAAYGHIHDEILSQQNGRPKGIVKFPHTTETGLVEMLKAVEWVAEGQGVDEAKNLILSLKSLLRVTEYDTSVHLGKTDSNAVVRFDVVVPDSMKNMVILDASANINTLMMLDKTIFLPDNLPELHLSYGGTVFHRIDHPAGRGAMQNELESNGRNLLAGILEIIQRHPNERILLFTFKHRTDEIHHRGIIEKYLTDNGVDIHVQIDGKPRFSWLTHGNETASNKYAHCSVAIFAGLMHKPREVSLGETVAQGRDHTAIVSEKLLTQVIRGMLSQALHQGANRTASRTIENDQANPVSIYYTYKDDALVPYLEQVLPDAHFRVYDSEVMSARTLTLVGKKAVVMFLSSLAGDVRKIAVRTINKAVAEVAEVSSSTRKIIINLIIDDPVIPWTRTGKSLVRV
ncbi:MAG: hypothetical protein ACI8PB_002040 [Desulforhopalus sp.]|jgi:hypothetical protein